ncbi:MAG: ribosomal L7Ae/L30e/S12e/Gadd45 family protein [Candidatus Caldarchaeum sp.]
MDLRQSLQVVSRTGSYVVGYRQTLKKVIDKKAAVVVASTKSHPVLLTKMQIYSKANDVPLLLVDLSPAELGLALRKPFPTSFIGIIDPGSSDLLEKSRSENAWEKA